MSKVTKSYDGVSLVVKTLDLEIRQGEFLTLLGPSGSGKTTTLMMLAGFEAPTSGDILLSGVDITRTPPHKRGLGVVFQNYALFPHMTVAENIGYALKVRGVPKGDIAAAVDEALAMVKLQGFGARRPAQLSGGQQQRVALARALVFKPELILLDEPLGALDKKLREQMQYELTQIHRQLGVTMIYVTHDQSEALTMSDRVAVFDDGVIQQLASPVELYERPANAFVAEFIGENNRLEGTVTGHETDDMVRVRLRDDTVVIAKAMDRLSEGNDVSLSIRPERITNVIKDDLENVFTVPVNSQVYFGDSIRDILSFGGTDEFIIKTDNSEFSRSVGQSAEMKIGWRAKDCLAFARR